jgi:transcriptional regulator with XRE-family HTH domain
MSIIPSGMPTHVPFLNLVGSESCSTNQATNVADADVKTENLVPRSAKPTGVSQSPAVSSTAPAAKKTKLHRIAEVRASQGMSERTICKRLNIDLKQLRALEDPTSDIPLSTLLAIREVLDVPLEDLVQESGGLARPIQERAKLVKIMKTAVSIKECKLSPRASRLSEMLNEQLVELMPELNEVGGWPEFGSRRGADSLARVLTNEVDTSQFVRE